MISRRLFLGWGIALPIASVLPGFLLKALADTSCQITIASPQMRSRVQDFRNQFVNSYLTPQKPYPVFSAMVRAGIVPTDLKVEKQLGKRGSAIFSGMQARIDAGQGGTEVDAVFNAQLLDQQLTIAVAVPKTIDIDVQNNADALAFHFPVPLLFQLLNRPIFNGVAIPLPSRLLLYSITLSNDAFEYDFRTASSNAPVVIKLDLRDNSTNQVNCASLATRFSGSVGLVAACLLVLLNCAACTTDVHPGQPPPQAYGDKEYCYNALASDVAAGYIRIDSKAGGLQGCPALPNNGHNVFIYADYAHKNPGDQMLVCADAGVPNGWEDISGSYADNGGCDAGAVPSGFANERAILKCTNASLPECTHAAPLVRRPHWLR